MAVRVVERLAAAVRILWLRTILPDRLGRAGLAELLESLDRRGRRRGLADPAPLVARLMRPLRWWRTSCLWRALAGYALLREAGADVHFVIGVRTGRGEEGLKAHAWLERDGAPSLGAPPPAHGYRVAFAWPADGGTLRPSTREDIVAGLRASDEVVLTELKDGTGVLLHVGTKFYYTLNRTGVLAWKLVVAGSAEDEAALASAIAARYPAADPAAVAADVAALVADLRQEGLLSAPG